MSRYADECDDENEDGEEISSSDNGDDLQEDIEALRLACLTTESKNHDNIDAGRRGKSPEYASAGYTAGERDQETPHSDSESEDDIGLSRNIENRFSLFKDMFDPLSMNSPIGSSDDDENDFEILRVIQRRFAAYETTYKPEESSEKNLQRPLASVTSSDVVNRTRTNTSESLHLAIAEPDKGCNFFNGSESMLTLPSGIIEHHLSAAADPSVFPMRESNFPESAKLFLDAIKKNRSYQKLLRSKLTQLQARTEENQKLKERLKVLKDFQLACKQMTGRALSQKNDPLVQLISVRKSGDLESSEGNDIKVSARHHGPAENCHVANYRKALVKFAPSLECKKWSKAERDNLAKGIRQQFQEMLFQASVDKFSCSDESFGDAIYTDNILQSINDLEIAPEMIRKFLPKVNWDQVASTYVAGRSAPECETQWLNWEDTLINREQWTAEEDKDLLLVIQEKGIKNWFDIAVSLGTNRTPFQCLARYQRSLNASILKQEWTKDEDDQLCKAVRSFGEHDWQSVASMLKGRTGTQCSNRWMKSLHPTRQRVGRWTSAESKRLKVVAMLFGAKNWNKIAQFVPGRTQVQCREKWVNSLDPALNTGQWTEEEDLKLKEAVAEHGCCWAKVAAHLTKRTDNMCWRRWKALAPDKVPLLKEARRMQKLARIGNFVDRETERPTFCPHNFAPQQMICSVSKDENRKPSRNQKKKLSNIQEQVRSMRNRKRTESFSQSSGLTSGHEVEVVPKEDAIQKKKKDRVRLRKNHSSKPTPNHENAQASMRTEIPPVLDHHSDPLLLTLISMRNGEEVVKPKGIDRCRIKNFRRQSKKKIGMVSEVENFSHGDVTSNQGSERISATANHDLIMDCGVDETDPTLAQLRHNVRSKKRKRVASEEFLDTTTRNKAPSRTKIARESAGINNEAARETGDAQTAKGGLKGDIDDWNIPLRDLKHNSLEAKKRKRC